ncbi:unnamed protein product, partial [Mesorhabditis spiculigera]
MPPKKPALHTLAPLMPKGTPLRDTGTKKNYSIGEQFATGGFGRIYTCKEEGSSAEFCCKVEPNGNGPLFTEVNVFLRLFKADMIDSYKKTQGLKRLGLPYLVSSGVFEYKKEQYRYLIMPKYATSLEAAREKASTFDGEACLKICRPILQALEYMHSKKYVHADIKAANILLENPRDVSTAVLVDFGLARMSATNVEKPDKKRAHNGTAIFTSLDAHRGLQPSYRGDLEILLYNILFWLTGDLPWKKYEDDPNRVMAEKEVFVKSLDAKLKALTPGCDSWIKALFRLALGTDYAKGINFGEIYKIIDNATKNSRTSPLKAKTAASSRLPLKRGSADLDAELEAENISTPLKATKKVKPTERGNASTAKRAVRKKAVIDSEEDDETEEFYTPAKTTSRKDKMPTPVATNGNARAAKAAVPPSAIPTGSALSRTPPKPTKALPKGQRGGVSDEVKCSPGQLRMIPGMLNFAPKGRRTILINQIAEKHKRKARDVESDED